MKTITKEMLIATERTGEEDIEMAVRIVIKEAAYSFKYAEGLVSEEDAFGGDDWRAHYEEGVEASITILKEHEQEEVAGVLLDEIRCEDLFEELDEDYNEAEVLEAIMDIIYKQKEEE